MYRLQKISSFIAALLLVVAFLGQAPKQWLHDVIADHADVHHANTSSEAVVYAAGFQCDVAQQAVTSSFVLPANITVQPIVAPWASPDAPALPIHPFSCSALLLLRGPPVA